MTSSKDKARSLRLERLQSNIDHQLSQPDAALETLMLELQIGEEQRALWEGLHGAAARDGKEQELAKAYDRTLVDRRLRVLDVPGRATALLNAANFFQGIVGDSDAAERFLWRILETMPDHADAFGRLERKLSKAREKVRLVELYALVAERPPKPAGVIARAAEQVLSVLPSKEPVPDEACRKLLVLLPADASLLGSLERHCRETGRFALACELLEASLTMDDATDIPVLERRQALVQMYVGEAGTPEKALPHVEALLAEEPGDEKALAAGDRLLRVPSVSSRAAVVLQAARRLRRERGQI